MKSIWKNVPAAGSSARSGAVWEKLSELYAEDPHGLIRCHEASCIVLCAEIGFRAALARTENRGWRYREDYPRQDDENWLKWIIVKKMQDKMVVTTEPVPVDRYKIKPGQTRLHLTLSLSMKSLSASLLR